MRFDIIRQPLSVTMTIFTLLLALFWGRAFLVPLPEEALTEAATPLGGWIIWLQGELGVFGAVPSMLMILVNAIFITRVMTNNMVLAVRTYIPMVIYLLISCALAVSANMLCALISAYMIIRSSQFFIAGFRRSLSFDLFFRGAFLLGCAPLIYAPSVAMFPLLLVALRLFRRTSREAFIALGGGLLPLLLCSYVYWAMSNPITQIAVSIYETVISNVGYNALSPTMGIGRMVFFGALILITSLSIGTYMAHARTMRTKASRIYIYHIYMVVFSVVMLLLPSRSPADYPLLAISLSVVMPAYFVKQVGYFPSLLWLLLMGSAIVTNVLEFITR